ncbi:MAG: type IV toxin-antitoxin system AbiEi family antitoxin domain-containing protein [Acidimicrobiales bacterium]
MDAHVAGIATRQHGLFSRAQAVEAGATMATIRSRLDAGRWVRVGPGVYRIAGVPVTWNQRALAACLVAGHGAVVSHRSAAVVWGISGFRPGPLEITVPPGRSNRNALARVHRSPVDGVRREGIPVTRPARTVADLAGVVSGARLEEAVDDALCRRLCRLDEVTAPAGRRGSAALRTVLEAWNGDALPDGVAEMRVVRRLLAAGLPQPVRQHEIHDNGRFVARVDLAYPQVRLAIELDGFRWHAGRGPFRSDRLRRNRIEAAGWRLLETAPDDIDELCRAAAQILRWAA